MVRPPLVRVLATCGIFASKGWSRRFEFPGWRDHAVVLTKRGRELLERHRDRVVLDYELKRDYQKWLHENDAPSSLR